MKNPKLLEAADEYMTLLFADKVPDVLLAWYHQALAGDSYAGKLFVEEVRKRKMDNSDHGKIINNYTKNDIYVIIKEFREKKC